MKHILEVLDEFEEACRHPREFYMTSEESFNLAIEDIEHELEDRVGWFQEKGMEIDAYRLKEDQVDLEMLTEIGSCKGVENYSRHFDRRSKGEGRSVC